MNGNHLITAVKLFVQKVALRFTKKKSATSEACTWQKVQNQLKNYLRKKDNVIRDAVS